MSRTHLFEGVCRWFAPLACGPGYPELCVGLLWPMPAGVWRDPICVCACFFSQSSDMASKLFTLHYSWCIAGPLAHPVAPGCVYTSTTHGAINVGTPCCGIPPPAPSPNQRGPLPQTRHPTLAATFNLSPPVLASELVKMPDATPST